MPDDANLIDDSLEGRRAGQQRHTLHAMGVDVKTLADAFAEAQSRVAHVPMQQDPLGEFVRCTVCAKDDGGTYRDIAFERNELQDPSHAGKKFSFGAKVRLKRDAFLKRKNREEVLRAE